jgi:hypothetical protein
MKISSKPNGLKMRVYTKKTVVTQLRFCNEDENDDDYFDLEWGQFIILDDDLLETKQKQKQKMYNYLPSLQPINENDEYDNFGKSYHDHVCIDIREEQFCCDGNGNKSKREKFESWLLCFSYCLLGCSSALFVSTFVNVKKNNL